MSIEWRVFGDKGRVLCFCREQEWNVNTSEALSTCPKCGSSYESVTYHGRYVHWKPVNVTKEAREIENHIRELKYIIRRCTSRELLLQIIEMCAKANSYALLDEFYDLAYSILFEGGDYRV